MTDASPLIPPNGLRLYSLTTLSKKDIHFSLEKQFEVLQKERCLLHK